MIMHRYITEWEMEKKLVLFSLPGNEIFGEKLALALNAELGMLTTHKFPDGETYVRIDTNCEAKDVVLVNSLHHPDESFLTLQFTAYAIREMKANRVVLVAPYLSYMRQDARFQSGEAVTSKFYAHMLSDSIDGLVTVDPHLHRYQSLNEIYSVPTSIVHAAPLIAKWISENISNPLLVGPDMESEQWVANVSKIAAAPYVVLNKVRHGDRNVEINIPNLDNWSTHTPVLIDDIISTAHTLAETIFKIRRKLLNPPICVGVHGIFADGSEEAIENAGVSRVVTCNTITHPSNAIDVIPMINETVKSFLTDLRELS